MTAQRILAWLLVAVQAAALGLQSRTVLFPSVMAGAALVGALARHRVRLTADQALRAGALLALVFYAKYLIAPHSIPPDRLFIRTELALALGQYLLVMQAAQLFVLRTDRAPDGGGRSPQDRWRVVRADGPLEDGLTLLLPGLGVIAMICFAAVRVNEDERQIYQALVVMFVLFAGLYFTASRRLVPSRRRGRPLARPLASGAALIAVASFAWIGSELLVRHERSIEQFISELLSPSHKSTGFTADGTLGSVSRRRDADRHNLALTIVSDGRPGYLRGQVFDTFQRLSWRSTASRQGVGSSADVPREIAERSGRANVFPVQPMARGEWSALEVWPALAVEETLFHPLGTTHVALDAESLLVDRNGNIAANGWQPSQPYTVFPARRPTHKPLDEWSRQPLEAQPEEWQTEHAPRTGDLVRTLARQLFADCRTTADRIAAVERYFRGSYRYDPEVRVPPGRNPLDWFLRDKPAAYCEYFATAAALVLREGGVPARYVTGFVATERHRFGDYWVARNNDAHAWVEAWDDERGWVTVEATPAEGVPEPAPPSALAQFWEYVKNGFDRLRMKIARDGLAAVLPALAAFFTSVPGVILALALAGWIAFRLRRVRRRSRRTAIDPRRRTLQRLLARTDRRLRRRGWQRRPSETLHQFAARLIEADPREPGLVAAAEWYLEYAAVRYDARRDAAGPSLPRRLPHTISPAGA
ncbi:MAG TPA: transglutaminase domain-containing protein [Planctomycetaceae bacterium]|nr:transglutaminase domain-containing protein [Planctomycetaceae bacterium]